MTQQSKKTILSLILLVIGSHFSLAYTINGFGLNSFSDDTTKKPTKPVRQYHTQRLTTSKPKIDGILNDSCWQTGEWSGDFTQLLPNEGAKPSQPSFIKILYDDKNLYIAIQAMDSLPHKIQRKLGRRDEFEGDMVGINLDSYHDYRTGFEFNVTAAGQKIDLMLFNLDYTSNEQFNFDMNWNAVWYVKTGLNEKGWVAEYEIPFSQLRYSNKDEQVWGLHVWRWIGRIQEESDWEEQSLAGPGVLYQFGELHGIKGLKKSRRIELMPYALGKLGSSKNELENPFYNNGKELSGAIGLDAKIGLSSNFTLDLTVNPDFGQVESDPSVMNLTAFETYFEEKRPFFLEGVNIFNFEFDDDKIFYSRRIGHSPSYTPDKGDGYMKMPENTSILSALKLSGKTSNGFSVGILQSLTQKEFADIQNSQGSSTMAVEPMSNYFVGRIQQDFDKGNTVLGGIFTSANKFINDSHLNSINRNAYTGGLDIFHQWAGKKYYLQAKVLGSYINGDPEAMIEMQNSSARYYQRPDADYVEFDSTITKMSGFGGKVKIGKGSGLWKYSTDVSWHSPGLELNDLGYMQTADIITQRNAISYFVNKPVSIFRTYLFALSELNNWDFGGNYLNSEANLYAKLDFLNQWGFSNEFNFANEGLNNKILRGGDAMILPSSFIDHISINTNTSKKFVVTLNVALKQASNFSFRHYIINPLVSYRIIDPLRFTFSLDYLNNFDELQYVDTKDYNGEKRYVLGRIDQKNMGFTFRIDYNITPELSIQYYGSPYASIGKFKELKYATNPKAKNYNDRFALYDNLTLEDNIYQIDEDGDLLVDYTIDNPDYNFGQFRSNLVARWEFKPGSSVYFVWAMDNTNETYLNDYSLNSTFSNLFDTNPKNIFLVKFSYWFSL
ncbi:MAG: DUF5916 domain-containing protein [Bacteroidales bacterium]